MLDTGWIAPGTVVGNRGGGSPAWTDPSNAIADDGSDATWFVVAGLNTSQGLAATNFDFSAIPVGAKIDGIEIQIGDFVINATGGSPTWNEASLILADNSDGIENKNGELAGWTTSPQTDTAGGATDLWGESLQPADVQDVDFGFFVVTGIGAASSHTFSIDFVRMKVFYSDRRDRVAIGTGLSDRGRMPIFRSSAGAYYCAFRSASTVIDVSKTIDPHTVAWAVQDGGNNPSGSTRASVDCVQSGDVIHIAYHITLGGDNEYRYSSFDMSTDLWDVVDETIEVLTDTIVIAPYIQIGVRDDGDVVVVYIGINGANMGDDKTRVDVDVRTAGPDTWSGPTALDAGGDVHYGCPCIIKGPLTDDMHILWSRTTNTDDPPALWEDSQARTLNPADGLSGVVTDGIDTQDKIQGWNNGISYVDGSTERIVFGGVNSNGSAADLVYAIGTEDGGDDFQFGTSVTDAVTEDPFIGGNGAPNSLAVDVRGFLHTVYGNDDFDEHLYTKSEDDGATWDTEFIIENNIVTNVEISTSILIYRAAYNLFWVYNDAGTWYVNSMELYPFEPSWRDQPYTIVREELR